MSVLGLFTFVNIGSKSHNCAVAHMHEPAGMFRLVSYLTSHAPAVLRTGNNNTHVGHSKEESRSRHVHGAQSTEHGGWRSKIRVVHLLGWIVKDVRGCRDSIRQSGTVIRKNGIWSIQHNNESRQHGPMAPEAQKQARPANDTARLVEGPQSRLHLFHDFLQGSLIFSRGVNKKRETSPLGVLRRTHTKYVCLLCMHGATAPVVTR